MENVSYEHFEKFVCVFLWILPSCCTRWIDLFVLKQLICIFKHIFQIMCDMKSIYLKVCYQINIFCTFGLLSNYTALICKHLQNIHVGKVGEGFYRGNYYLSPDWLKIKNIVSTADIFIHTMIKVTQRVTKPSQQTSIMENVTFEHFKTLWCYIWILLSDCTGSELIYLF